MSECDLSAAAATMAELIRNTAVPPMKRAKRTRSRRIYRTRRASCDRPL
jgi:hypothetical protein